MTRAQPLGGLTWFAALDVVIFTMGPGGVSWLQVGGLPAGTLALVGIGVAIALARMPESVIGLAAFAVIAVQILGAGFGYLPGSLLYSITPVVLTMIAFLGTRLVRRRFVG